MNTHTRIDDKLFTPLTARDASVSLAELQQYVTANPPVRSNRPYVAAAIVMCIGVGLFFLLGDNIPEPTITELPSIPQVVPQVLTPPVAENPSPAVTPVRELSRKQRTRQSSRMANVPKGPVLPNKDLGLTEQPLLPDPRIVESQQFALECNDPSFLVALARIEFSASPDPNID